MKLWFFSAYSYVAGFFNVSGDQPLNSLDNAAMPWCTANDFDTARAQIPISALRTTFLVTHCVYAAYFHVILTEAYKLSPTRIGRFAANDGTTEITWAMGAMVAACITHGLPPENK